MAKKAEKMLLIYYNKRMIMQYATFSKNLNPRNIEKSVSDIRIRFPFDSRFWISVFGCKLTILPDIQPANRMVIISDTQVALRGNFSGMLYKPGKSLKRRGQSSSLHQRCAWTGFWSFWSGLLLLPTGSGVRFSFL